jgi:DNA-binding IclR family transcriptional regulator
MAVRPGTTQRVRRQPRAATIEPLGQTPQVAQSVDRALAVLNLFRHEQPELSLTEIAEQARLHPSTVHRLLATLEATGYVQRVARTGHYRLGLKIVELTGIALNQMDLVRHSLAELDTLRDRLNLNANLAVLFQDDVFHLAYAVRSDTPRLYTTVGRRAVAHCTALGKVLLAAQPRDAVHQDIERRGWRPYTPRSIQDFEALDRCLDEVATRGYAVDSEERNAGTACIAAPVSDHTRRVIAAISVSGPVQQFEPPERTHIVAMVVEHARRISRRLGDISA